MSTVLSKDVYISSGLNFFWLVYKSLKNFNLNITTDSQGQIAGRLIKNSEDWCFDYIDYVSNEQSLGEITITTTGAMESGDIIFIDQIGSSTKLLNPFEETYTYTSIYSKIKTDNSIDKWKINSVSSSNNNWNVDKFYINSSINQEISASSNTLSNSMSAGGYSAWWTSSDTMSSGDTIVFSAYIKPSGATKLINANNGILFEIDEYTGSGWNQYTSRCFLPSGKTDFTRCSFAHTVGLTAPIVRAGIYCSNSNTHGDSYPVIISGYKFEKLENNKFPLKGRPTTYIGSGDLIGYELRVGNNSNTNAYISNVVIDDGVDTNSSLNSLEKYNGDNSFNIQHTSYDAITVIKNNSCDIDAQLNSLNVKKNTKKPHYIKNGAYVTMEFRYKTNSLICNSGGGISYGYELWSDIGQHEATVELDNSIYQKSNFERISKTFLNDNGNVYITPYIMVSGCKGTTYIDDVKLYDRDLYNRTRKHVYDEERHSYNLKISDNYVNLTNQFRESLGGIIWQDENDDVFIQDTITLDRSPNWNFIWRDSVYYYPYRTQQLEIRIANAKANGGIEKVRQGGLGNNYVVNGETLATLEAQWNYRVYNGFEDHAEEVEQTTYIDSITMDEDYIYILYHTNNILKTKNGSEYNKEFRSNPNRYYIARGIKGESNYDLIRLNDGLSRDISLNDGKFFTYPVYPERNLTGISWASGAMSNDGDVNHSLQTWRSQIYDIATHPNSAFVFYCGTHYWWDDETSEASQTLKSANFIGAIPKSFPDTVGDLNIQIGNENGAVEKQYGVIIYTSGNSDASPSGLHPGEVDLSRFVGLSCTGELFDGADIHSLIIAQSSGNNDTSIDLKLLTHTAYNNILDVEFGNFAYDGGAEEPEANYNSDYINILDIARITDVTLPSVIYNGMINYPSGASITPFHLSFNDKNKMLYSYTRMLSGSNFTNKFSIFKDFNKWSYENRYFYDGISSQPINGLREYGSISISGESDTVESYSFPITISGYSTDIDKTPILVFFDYQSDYISYLDGNRIINSEDTEQLVGNIKTLYRTSFQCDGQNIVSKYADGSKGFKKQTEYIDSAQYKEPIITCLTSYGDEYVMSNTPLVSGTFNNKKITKDYTINYLTGEITYNKIPTTIDFTSQELLSSNTNGAGYYTVLSGSSTTGNAYDDELYIKYTNRYTIPFSWAADESVVEFLEKIAKADNANVIINNDGDILYRPDEFIDSVNMSTNGYQAINNNMSVIKNISISVTSNEGNVKNPLFDEISPISSQPVGWDITSYGNGNINTTSDISKFSRRAAIIASSGKNYVGKLSSSPVSVSENTDYTITAFYNSFNISKNNYIEYDMLLSGSFNGWTFDNSNVITSFSSKNILKNDKSIKLIVPANEEINIYCDNTIYCDKYENIVFNVGLNSNTSEGIVKASLIFYDYIGISGVTSIESAIDISQNYISVTGNANSISREQLLGANLNLFLPNIYISGGSTDSIIYLNSITVSGDRGSGGLINIYDIDSNGNVICINSNNVNTNTVGFTKFVKNITTCNETKYIIVEPSLKYSDGILLVDGIRVDKGTNSEEFVIGDSLIHISDFPVGATTFTKDYRDGFDYIIDNNFATIKNSSNNLVRNGYFENYTGVIPDSFIVSISGENELEYPLLIKTSGGYFTDNSIAVSFSGTGFAEIITGLIDIDEYNDYQITSYYKAISGSSYGDNDYLSNINMYHRIYYYDNNGKLLRIYNGDEAEIIWPV